MIFDCWEMGSSLRSSINNNNKKTSSFQTNGEEELNPFGFEQMEESNDDIKQTKVKAV